MRDIDDFRSALEPPPDFENGREVIPELEKRCNDERQILREAEKKLRHLMESPIEVALGLELFLVASKWGFEVVPQYKLSRYRYDFAVFRKDVGELAVLVECDGRAFHSTHEQIANDRAKDAAARKAGTSVYRLPGFLIKRNPIKCANDIIFSVWRAW